MDEHLPVKRASWPWISLTPLGLGAWAPILAGRRVNRGAWVLLGLLWSVIAAAGWVIAVSNPTHGSASGLAGVLLILGWVGGIATSFALRPAYDRLTSSPVEKALANAEERLSERERARHLAERSPQLALEMGIGRPDLPGSAAAGLVDVNNAPESALLTLPGVDEALATRIIETRAEVRGFSSLPDMGATLDLDGDMVEALREFVVCLPRGAAKRKQA